jgi:5-methylcytosine-specific restriction endonuclease McrA
MEQQHKKAINFIKKHNLTTEYLLSLHNINELNTIRGVGTVMEQSLINYIENELQSSGLISKERQNILNYFNDYITIADDHSDDHENKNKQQNKILISKNANINLLNRVFHWIKNIDNLTGKKLFNLFIHCIKHQQAMEEIIRFPMNLKDILNINFPQIDKIALSNQWWNKYDVHRVESYILHLFEKYAENKGSIYLTENDFTYLYKQIDNDSQITFERHQSVICGLVAMRHLKKFNIKDGDTNIKCWAPTDFYNCEKNIYECVKNMIGHNRNSYQYGLDDIKLGCEIKQLHNNQLQAIRNIIHQRISILQGGPGTGKTSTVLKAICQIIVKNNKQFLFVAPTHSAKNRAKTEITTNTDEFHSTNCLFTTIQSTIFNIPTSNDQHCNLIEYVEKYDFIIVDEMSMTCSKDFQKFIKIINNSSNLCSLVLVGDHDQLPPISYGQPFHDLIKSNLVPTYHLTKNFRALKSTIPSFLEEVNKKNFIFNKTYPDVHTYFNNNNTYIKELNVLLQKFKHDGLSPYNPTINDNNTFQIITPFNDIIYDSNIVQNIRNVFFGINTKDFYYNNDIIVMNKNNRFFKNGDYARIINIAPYTCTIQLFNPPDNMLNTTQTFEDCSYDKHGNVVIHITGVNNINKNNALFKPSSIITVHKSQGLGFAHVVTIYNKQSSFFIQKKLNYTAFSRAKMQIHAFGNKKNYTNFPQKPRNTIIHHLLNNSISLLAKKIKPTFNKNDILDTQTIIEENIRCRKSIQKKIKHDVWIKRHTKHTMNGKCFICSNNIKYGNFHTGHIISIENGGTNTIDNLETICSGCNKSIGKEKINYYKQKYCSNNSLTS